MPLPIKKRIEQELIVPLKAVPAKVSYTKMENLHLTLKFIGDAEKDDLQSLYENLCQKIGDFGKVTLSIDRCGYFGSKNFPRVIWLGLAGELDRLEKVVEIVENETAKIGAKKENKAFSPHITLGRLKRPDNSNYLLAKLEQLPALNERFEVDKIYIKESVLKPDGPIYKDLYEIIIGGGRGDEKQ